ncbi:S-formylglutathione hydrolase FrmB [Agromyces terreus]|uniref:S-formylglutathione hydrolase FrmB n=1 Tax=Agromyces terreus TaxID=424795 RepID=A0A9X2GWG3_9MICO|nr:alpha/beta hydrolase family protein [Agromyces terreus]MCP2370320.1 S-formylglutathione hydrolase FrmB [Agromyces terreus]
MALLQCSFQSRVLGMATKATVILPEPAPKPAPDPTPAPARQRRRVGTPVLYLLHGMGDDETAWTRRTAIERYVEGYDLAVVMPTVHRGYYTDQTAGHDYWTYVTEELPALVASWFTLSSAPADTFAAGLSMGGYGAFKWALRKPGSIAAAASLSGGLDVTARPETPEWRATFGSRGRARDHGDDLMHLARSRADAACPKLLQWCGSDDENLEENRRFRDVAAAAGLPLEYSESPGGHDWHHWDQQIRRVLEWLPLRRLP